MWIAWSLSVRVCDDRTLSSLALCAAAITQPPPANTPKPPPPKVDHPVTRQVHRFWFEAPTIGKPFHEHALGDEARLFPRDCREAVS